MKTINEEEIGEESFIQNKEVAGAIFCPQEVRESIS